jgi:hypothetical protein
MHAEGSTFQVSQVQGHVARGVGRALRIALLVARTLLPIPLCLEIFLCDLSAILCSSCDESNLHLIRTRIGVSTSPAFYGDEYFDTQS